MKDSQKTRLVLVVSANLILSAVVGVAIWNGADKAKKDDAKKVSAVSSQSVSASASSSGASGTVAEEVSQQPVLGEQYPSTKRENALLEAKRNAGRQNPMLPIVSPEDSRAVDSSSTHLSTASRQSTRIPAPPQVIPDMELPKPPDPETVVTKMPAVHERPLTPERKLRGVRITGIIGNKAMFLMRREGARRSETPEVICLAPGEHVNTINNVPISVLQVDKDTVTLEVDGDRMIKVLPEIR